MVITNLEHLSWIALENDGRNLDRETSAQVRGGSQSEKGKTVKAKVRAQSQARGQIAFTVTLGIAFAFAQ